MNKRIKKKLQKRLGYMRYANYRISQTPISFTVHDGVHEEKISTTLSAIHTINGVTKNRRVYPESVVMKAINDYNKRMNSHDFRFVGENLHPPVTPTFSIRSI